MSNPQLTPTVAVNKGDLAVVADSLEEFILSWNKLDKTHQNDPIWPTQKGPLCQLKGTRCL
jgi:hypothetical protein